MGRRHIRVVRVSKRTTRVLLLMISILMAGLVYLLSGRAYAAGDTLIRDVLARIIGSGRVPQRATLLAAMMPVIANVLLFVPWGFLAFLSIDEPGRSRRKTVALTLAGAILFAAAMQVWQAFLPTRVTSVADTLSNGIGALAGAALGYARREVHVRFEI